ncbi:MAG TPA: DEAD/DEAH box helicase [Candidatus Omnitrophota bacterium]|nr:DEAD/DEAH box helicase [Candidatus Omnitrophota bacterium]HPS37744.1 DEAD/DEAH box helicase [Candidatus Omnitrophota bacterium]
MNIPALCEPSQDHFLKKNFDLTLPPDFELSDEFLAAFDAIENTDKNLYITGEAGTGKTTLLKYFRQNTRTNFIVLAPTGIAAINSHGQTIHSFFKFPPKLIQKNHVRKVYTARQIFESLDLLIVDEASMMRADLMDGIDHALRVNKGRPRKPFGGVRVVLFGDLFQLPPIVDRDIAPIYSSLYETPYFFSANVFKKVKFHQINLKKIYRQKDGEFKGLLNKIRNRSVTADEMNLLNVRVDPVLCDAVQDCITLTPTNAAAKAINDTRLAGLSGKEFVYDAVSQGEFDANSYPTETALRLKKGAQVLMIRNDPEKRWVNGSIGEVVELNEESIQVRIGQRTHRVEAAVWEKITYRYDEDDDKIVEDVAGSFEQYPIKLAWAITIHKSQGLTFDKLIIDLAHGAFSHGQVYVALSRCRSFEGVLLRRPVKHRDIIFDPRIHRIADHFPEWKAK